MADPNSISDWAGIVNAALPFLGGGGGAMALYVYHRKIDADNRKLDRDKIIEQRTEIKDKNDEIKDLQGQRDALQERLNEAYRKLYPDRSGVTDES